MEPLEEDETSQEARFIRSIIYDKAFSTDFGSGKMEASSSAPAAVSEMCIAHKKAMICSRFLLTCCKTMMRCSVSGLPIRLHSHKRASCRPASMCYEA